VPPIGRMKGSGKFAGRTGSSMVIEGPGKFGVEYPLAVVNGPEEEPRATTAHATPIRSATSPSSATRKAGRC
jgi:hypothetical protein